jgi:LPXTG-site transpeptidase (sortase) family protein
MQPNDPQSFDPGTFHPPQDDVPSSEPVPELSPQPDYGNEAAVAFARAKLEALLREQHPDWQVPADHTTYAAPSDQPASQPMAPTEPPTPPQPPYASSASQSIYPTPTQPLMPAHPIVDSATAPETIPEAQYEVETALQDEVQPQFHHVSPSHQLPAEPPTPLLQPADNSRYQTMQIPGQPEFTQPQPVMQPPLPATETIVPPADMHKDQPQPSRSEQIKSYAENTRSAIRGVHHSFLKPILKTTIVTLIVFLIYNAPLVMGQVYYYITPASNDPTPVILDPSVTSVTADPRVIISKLNIDVPAVYDEESYDERKIQEALERGIVHYGTTALPGEKGNAVFLGHSSNSPWAPGKFKTAFSLLRKLQVNDTFVLHYEKKRYIYQVYERKVIDPSDFSVISQDVEQPIATLITCDPPGANWNRLVIHARQISPSPADNKPHRGAAVPEGNAIPGSPPSLWERVTSIF